MGVSDKETYSEAEAKARTDVTLKKLLATPPMPKKAKSKKRSESSQSK